MGVGSGAAEAAGDCAAAPALTEPYRTLDVAGHLVTFVPDHERQVCRVSVMNPVGVVKYWDLRAAELRTLTRRIHDGVKQGLKYPNIDALFEDL